MVLTLQAAAYEGPKRDILIDVGTADSFLENQLKPDDFSEAAAGNKALTVQLRKQARPTLGFCYLVVFVLQRLCSPACRGHALPCRCVRALGAPDMRPADVYGRMSCVLVPCSTWSCQISMCMACRMAMTTPTLSSPHLWTTTCATMRRRSRLEAVGAPVALCVMQ